MRASRLAVCLVFAGVAVMLASCSLFSGEGLSNIRTATDETGKTPTVSYTPLQTFCVLADVRGVKDGSVIQAKWFVVNAAGVAPDTRINTSDYIYKSGVGHVYFKLATWDESSWPVGSYRVVLFVDGLRIGEQDFSVK